MGSLVHHGDVGLSDVMPSAAASLGVPGFEDRLGIGAADAVVVCLVDGLGSTCIESHPDLFPALEGARGGSIQAAFPTTTATGLASLGTGMESGQHGIVGASFWLPESERVLSPLHWGSDPSPLAVQPETTVLEQVAASHRACVAVGPSAYAGSGLTQGVLRGSTYRSAESIDDRIAVTGDAIEVARREGRQVLVYVYWPALDRAGHEHGVGSDPWISAAGDVEHLLARLRGILPSAGRLVVTADHGMVDAGERVWLEDQASLSWGVRLVAGEPRMRHVYCEPGEIDNVRDRWRDVLQERALVYVREEAIAQDLFGTVDPLLADRVGDVVVIAQLGMCLTSRRIDPRVSALPGQHGGLSSPERRIPGLVLDPI